MIVDVTLRYRPVNRFFKHPQQSKLSDPRIFRRCPTQIKAGYVLDCSAEHGLHCPSILQRFSNYYFEAGRGYSLKKGGGESYIERGKLEAVENDLSLVYLQIDSYQNSESASKKDKTCCLETLHPNIDSRLHVQI